MRSFFSPLALLFVALTLSSCVSPKFERAWKGAAALGASGGNEAAATSRLSGQTARQPVLPTRWQGRWHSDRHNSGGRLRAVVQPLTDGQAEIFFEAGWHGFTTAYPVSLSARRKGNAYQLSGEHDLKSCVGGGVYSYTGSLQADQFSASYDSKYDTGTFLLTPAPRPKTEAPRPGLSRGPRGFPFLPRRGPSRRVALVRGAVRFGSLLQPAGSFWTDERPSHRTGPVWVGRISGLPRGG